MRVIFRIQLLEVFNSNKILSQTNSNYKGTLLIYGQLLNDRNLYVNDILIEEANESQEYEVIEFPLVRKPPYRDDCLHILIKSLNRKIDYSKTIFETYIGITLRKKFEDEQDFI